MQMTNLYIPICGFLCTIFLLINFYSKQRVRNIETQLFSGMLLTSFIDGIMMISIILTAYLSKEQIFLLKVLNKIDYLQFLLWIWFFFLYVVHISYKDNVKVYKKYNNLIKVSGIINILAYFLILIFPVKLYNTNNIMYSYGPSCDILYFVASTYIILIIVTLIINIKKIFGKKYIPVYIFTIFEIIVLIMKNVNPGLVIITAVLAYVNLIMFFTIENPDLKMIEQLEHAKDQADKANRAKTDFLSSMSHEIRTPLNAIMGFSDCINHAETLEEAKENAKDIINASSTLLEIVNGILDISKIEAGKLEIINSPYNARSTFEELAKLIKPKMQEKGLDFSYYIAPDLPNVLYGDHANIKKVVTNLLSNAAKYTEKGFVRYEVNCINTESISKIIISVEDSGRGIKQENIDKLFTKFQRLEEDRNTTIEGTGLGLAITKQLTELMGGKIIVHTVYGEGSKFTVVINQPIEKKDIKVEETVKTTLDLKGVKILIVDDNTLNLKVATKLLERYNADSITCVESGFKCLDKIGNGENYDVILMDDMMPKMSGVETLRRLKENRYFKIPVVALTANAITGMREKYLSEGFNDYLAKPIEKEDLIKVMNTLLYNESTETEKTPDYKEFIINDNEKRNLEEKQKLTVKENKFQIEKKELFKFSENKEEKHNDINVIPVEENIEEILENTQKLSIINDEKLQNNLSDKNKTTFQFIERKEQNESIKSTEIENLDEEEITEEKEATKEKTEDKYSEKEKFLRKKGIDMDKALELLGDMEMFEMTLKDFYDMADTKWLRIMGYKNSNDLENYAIEVHSLKSDSKYLGFMSLANIAYEHEIKSKDKDENFVRNHFNDLETEYNKTMAIIDEYYSLEKDRFTVTDLPF